jgi:competence protein ComEA
MNSRVGNWTKLTRFLALSFLLMWTASAWGQTKINVNQATASDLTALPGIGPSKAQAIVDYRNKNGAFRTVDSMTNVRGIGPKTLEKIRPMVSLGDGKTSAETTQNSSEPRVPSSSVNLNTASAQELTDLKGVGGTTATRIVEYRRLHGPFLSVDSITQVKGIGPSILKKNKDKLRVLLHVNQATTEQYRTFGFRNAEKITAFRSQKGNFLSPDSLKQVPGTDSEFLAYVRRILK